VCDSRRLFRRAERPAAGRAAAAPALGTYDVTTTVDLTATVLPAPASEYVETLAEFRRDPADALFRLLDDAGVPLVAELRAALRDVLEDRLADWLDDAILGRPGVAAALDALVAAAETTLVRLELDSELALSSSGATHRLRRLRFPGGVEVALPDLGAESADVHLTSDRLAIGAHGFGLRLGDAVLAALDATAHARYGMGFRETLSAIVDCPAVAADVADICVVGVCVGHAEALESLCEQGIDLLADEIARRIGGLDIQVLALHGGQTTVAGDRLTSGTWDAELDFGLGPARSAPPSPRSAANSPHGMC